jgi:cyclopropane fatty-acyl-phospholipid synthase-like methyltransferase
MTDESVYHERRQSNPTYTNKNRVNRENCVKISGLPPPIDLKPSTVLMPTAPRKTPEQLQALYGVAYVDSFNSTQLLARIERLLARCSVGKSDKVVDFGCGSGLLMPYLAPRAHSYTGVDFSSAFIATAVARQQQLGIANADFHCDDITHFCRQHQGEFDAAFALDFSEHVYDDEWLQILTAIRSSLKPGGRFYLHTPNREFFVEVLKAHNVILRQFPEHIAVRTPPHNLALLAAAGFHHNNLQLLPHYNVLKWLHWLSWLPLAGKYFKARIFIEARA